MQKKVTTYSGKIKSGKNWIGFKSGMVRFGFELSIFSSLRVGSLWIGFELGWVISGHATIRVLFGSGLVYFGSSGPNQFITFRVSVRV